ncbi:hypothetical protein [Tabrizicola sp.]|uniref:hypothetical protein n=1 Tax=Tabrizicola sp. TaxID=2005166 RepID=UPI0035B24712
MQTIAEAFAAWNVIEAQLSQADDATFTRLAQEQAQIEDAAVALPVTCAVDGWRLLAMTTEEGRDVTATADALFRRAREEAEAAAQSPLAAIFDQWLPLAQKSADGLSTEAEIDADLTLVRMAADLPAVEPLDIWRKVAMVFDVTEPRHAGAAAALMQEARAALGLTAPTQH